MDATDAQLWDRAVQGGEGSKDALTQIYRRHNQSMRQAVKRLLGPTVETDVVDEILQTTWTELLEARKPTFSIQSYLVIAVRNQAKQHLRLGGHRRGEICFSDCKDADRKELIEAGLIGHE